MRGAADLVVVAASEGDAAQGVSGVGAVEASGGEEEASVSKVHFMPFLPSPEVFISEVWTLLKEASSEDFCAKYEFHFMG